MLKNRAVQNVEIGVKSTLNVEMFGIKANCRSILSYFETVDPPPTEAHITELSRNLRKFKDIPEKDLDSRKTFKVT